MAYNLLDKGNGVTEVRTTGGIATIVCQDDGTFFVREDAQKRSFNNRGEALDCARELAHDPDL
jgi:hypothetical protein